MKKTIVLSLLLSTLAPTAFADQLAIETALGKVMRAQRLLDDATEELRYALESQNNEPLQSSMTVNSVGEFHCNDSGYEGSHFMKNAIDSIVSNISAQCLSTDRCGKRVRKEEIVFQYSVPSAFKCAVNGSYSY